MKIHTCVQGTTEWLRLRSGIPTASQFDKIVTPGGKLSSQAEKYMYALLAERMMGHPIADHISLWMARGSQMEAEAVRWYEFQRECSTVPVGFMTNDAATIGASPDRMCGEAGLLEIKVPNESTHMSYLMQSGAAYDAYKVQVQGQLWVSGRDWTDVMSYHPKLPEALIRIERDVKFISLLGSAVETFSMELERQSAELVGRGWMREDWRVAA